MTIKLRSNSKYLNRRKMSSCRLEQHRQGALADFDRYGDDFAKREVAEIEEAIRLRAREHYEYLLRVATYRKANGIAGADYFERRCKEVLAYFSLPKPLNKSSEAHNAAS